MDELQAGRELDALVAEKVMGWRQLSWRLWRDNEERDRWIDGDTSYPKQPCWSPSTDIAAAWEVHLRACSWLFSKRRQYFAALQEQTRTEDGSLVAWPDVLVVLRDKMPEVICRAALEVVKDENN